MRLIRVDVWNGDVAAISRPIHTTEKWRTTGTGAGGTVAASDEAVSSL
jgi:hypothetical protein